MAPQTGRNAWPVVLVLDGQDWVELPPVIDDAVVTGGLPPLLTVLVPSLDVSARVADLTCNPGFVSFLVDDVFDEVARRWPVSRDPRRVVIADKSPSGLTALYSTDGRCCDRCPVTD